MEAIRDVAVHYSGLAVPNGHGDSKFGRGLRVKAGFIAPLQTLFLDHEGDEISNILASFTL